MRRFFILCAVTALAACTNETRVSDSAEPLGQFRLGHNIAVADKVKSGPLAQDFLGSDLEARLQKSVSKRLRRYDGDGLYHLAIVVGGVALAQPGVPAVYAQKSILVVDVTVFDNETGTALNTPPQRFFVDEGSRNTTPFIGLGSVATPDAQLANLSETAARQIEAWLRNNPQWFEPRADQIRVPFDAAVKAPAIDTSSVQDVDVSGLGQ